MVKIEKIVKITIDGEDIETLKNMCELARIAIKEMGRNRFNYIEDMERGGKIDKLMQDIFEA